jgi:hypothetical protein
VTARAKAHAATLRRDPDDVFALEARRRGFARISVIEPVPVPLGMLKEMALQLEGGCLALAKRGEGHALHALHTMGSVLNKVECSVATFELLAETLESEAAE